MVVAVSAGRRSCVRVDVRVIAGLHGRTPASADGAVPVVKKGSRIRASKSRPAEPVAPMQQLAPTVRLTPRLPARMKIAV